MSLQLFLKMTSLIIAFAPYPISDANVYLKQSAIKKIIIDAGHGGRDTGAKGKYSFEKDICLDIALKLGDKIKDDLPGIEVIYTRTEDTYPEIKARANFANSNHGDLFLSIHVNAAPPIRHSKFIGNKTQVYYTLKGKKRIKRTRKVPKYQVYFTPNPQNGTETFIWAADRSVEKEKYIETDLMSENITIDTTEVIPDINDPEAKAKALLWTKRFFDKSYLLASMVEDEFVKANRPSRGVKQRNEKGIWVLQATSMPSILVETGFITYKAEEDFLNSKQGQDQVADNIFNAVKRYHEATK
jgi:N-acetylmuramoyl-L-alanine amidase